jgi:hypothetical protein
MSADVLLAEVFRRSDQLLAAWAVHAVTAVAVVALVVAVPAVRDSRRARRVLAGLFAFLALANLEGMLWILKQWRAVADGLGQSAVWVSSPAARSLAEVTDAPHPLWVVPFHLALDVLVVWVVLRYEMRPGAGEPVRHGG